MHVIFPSYKEHFEKFFFCQCFYQLEFKSWEPSFFKCRFTSFIHTPVFESRVLKLLQNYGEKLISRQLSRSIRDFIPDTIRFEPLNLTRNYTIKFNLLLEEIGWQVSPCFWNISKQFSILEVKFFIAFNKYSNIMFILFAYMLYLYIYY